MKVRVRVGKSRIAGQGLFTLQNIKKDIRVIQYVGERINKAQSAKRLAQGNAYIFTFSDQYDIDGKVLGNAARYINHSCDPNCAVDMTGRSIWIVAIAHRALRADSWNINLVLRDRLVGRLIHMCLV